LSTAMTEGVFSFHRMQQACRADEPAAWRHFIKNYAPLAKQLLRHYFPEQEQRGLLAQIFREARADQARLWRSFAGTNEKEFVLHFRYFLLAQGRGGRGGAPPNPLPPGDFLAGVPERRDHDALFAALEKQRGEACVPDKTYVRFVDGQLTWREREEVERHLENCFYCLNRFAAFREGAPFLPRAAPGRRPRGRRAGRGPGSARAKTAGEKAPLVAAAAGRVSVAPPSGLC